MRRFCESLAEIPLFRGLGHELFRPICEKTEVHMFWKGDLIVREGEFCPGLGYLIEGQAAVQKTTPNGDESTLELLESGDIFGEALIFGSKRHYSINLEAVSHCKVIYVKREDILQMISASPVLLNNFLCVLSDKIRSQDQRLHLLSQRSLRQKISAYLLWLLREQLEASGETLLEASKIVSTQAVELPMSKEMVARLLAMPRPSLSRELISMEKDGLIRVSGRVIWLVDLEGLQYGRTADAEQDKKKK